MKEVLKSLLWKVESTYGTDPVPTASANVLVAQSVDINPLEMDTDDYTPVSDSFGSNEMIVGATWASVSFDVLLCGSGTPGTAPNHGPALRAAGWHQTLTADTSAVYSLLSTGEESGTLYFYNDGVLHKMTGIRGSLSWNWTARKAPRMTFKGMGLNQPMVDSPLPVPTLPTLPRPLAMNNAHTVLTIGGYSARLSAFTIDQNNDVQFRDLTGRRDVSIVGRGMGGKVTIELPLVAEKDFLGANGICTQALAAPMVITHGSVPGNIVSMTLPRVQLMKPKPKAEAGILMLECDLHIARNNGNDELTFSYT